MNKKIILVLMVLFIAVASLSSVSAWWIFGGDTEVTVNEIKFNIPEGFEEDNSTHDVTSSSEKVEYVNVNDENLFIMVSDTSPNVDNAKELFSNSYYAGSMVDESISGKNGVTFSSSGTYYGDYPTVTYAYVENSKLIALNCPVKFEDGTTYYDFLDNVIK